MNWRDLMTAPVAPWSPPPTSGPRGGSAYCADSALSESAPVDGSGQGGSGGVLEDYFGLLPYLIDHKGAQAPHNALTQNPHNTQNPATDRQSEGLSPNAESAISADPPAPRRLWLVTPPDGPRFSLSCTLPATRAEVAALHPGALVELEQDPAPVLEPDAPHHLEQPPTPGPAPVSCASCGHYVPNPRGFGGLGRCLTSAPASKRPGSLWPRGEIVCREHLEAAHDPE